MGHDGVMHDTPVFGTFGVPAVPPPTLDPYLDAAARCFARHGLRRTRVTDIADEVGVSRVTSCPKMLVPSRS